MKIRLTFAAGVLVALSAPLATQAQGVIEGGEQGAAEGGRAAGPVRSAVGGVVGGVTGGVVGGAKAWWGLLNAITMALPPSSSPPLRPYVIPRRRDMNCGDPISTTLVASRSLHAPNTCAK